MLLVRRSRTVGDEVMETTKTKKRQKLFLQPIVGVFKTGDGGLAQPRAPSKFFWVTPARLRAQRSRA